ncbi:MAG: hypothetical protein KAI99_10135 [Cyclobacteriaceae bacterium]|nr:hypothetical protein [Cyclobacteriaceae bacterium]
MKTLIIFIATLIGISSCIVEVELDPPYIDVRNIDEYETKEIIHEVWSGGVLIYEEVEYHTWLEIEFHNTGGIRAYNVWAEIIFYNGHREIQTTTIYLPDIRSGNSYKYAMDTGFESIYDYTDYDVNVYWE